MGKQVSTTRRMCVQKDESRPSTEPHVETPPRSDWGGVVAA